MIPTYNVSREEAEQMKQKLTNTIGKTLLALFIIMFVIPGILILLFVLS